jgi:hypothetical protein
MWICIIRQYGLLGFSAVWRGGAGETHDLEAVGDDADGHELLSVVTAVHHQGVGETLDDRALCLSESLLGVSAGGVGDVDGGSDLDVVAGGVC